MSKSCQMSGRGFLHSAGAACIVPLIAAALALLVATVSVKAQNITPYEADLSGNQIVDFPDLAALGNQWGQTGSSLEADLNDDQAVNAADLSALARVWLTPWTPISSIGDVNDLMRENPAGCYALVDNVNASETATWNDGKGFEPLPEFTGYFNGAGHSILGLYVNRPFEENAGLFRMLSDGAQVHNLKLENGYVECDTNAGMLAGTIRNADISQILTSGTVVLNNKQGGGIVGIMDRGTITDSKANCNVSGRYDLGGIAGETSSGDPNNLIIFRCYSAGDIVGSRKRVGGLVGSAYKTFILGSFSTSTVNGDDPAGGLVGENVDGTSIIDNSYFTDPNHPCSDANLCGTYEPNGPSAFHGNTHPVYETWQFIDANCNGVWIPDANGLPQLRGPEVYDTNSVSTSSNNAVIPVRLHQDGKALEKLTLVERAKERIRGMAKAIIDRKENRRYAA